MDTTTLIDLPDDIIIEIFDRLHGKDVVKLSSVCKLMRSIKNTYFKKIPKYYIPYLLVLETFYPY